VLADLRSDRLQCVRHLGKPQPSYLKVTFRKADFEKLEHGNAELLGPGNPLYAAVDERLNEKLAAFGGGAALYVDANAETPYRLHLFEITVRGQNTKGDTQTLYGEVVAVREDPAGPDTLSPAFEVVPSHVLLDLPAHPQSPASLPRIDPAPAADFLKGTYQSQRRDECQAERRKSLQICRDYLEKAFKARQRFCQDRIFALRAREHSAPEVALARQRAENDLTDLERSHRERLAGLDRLAIARHGPVRHIATAVVVPAAQAGDAVIAGAIEELDPEMKRRIELAAEDVVIAHEKSRGWECTRVGHQKIGFDIRSLGPADPQTGHRDLDRDVRRIEVKGRKRGQPIRLTVNEWYNAQQLGDTYWLYVVWDPLGNPDPLPLMVQNPFKHLEHAARPVVAARFYDIPASSIEAVVRNVGQNG